VMPELPEVFPQRNRGWWWAIKEVQKWWFYPWFYPSKCGFDHRKLRLNTQNMRIKEWNIGIYTSKEMNMLLITKHGDFIDSSAI
jgi:hypothetical protein